MQPALPAEQEVYKSPVPPQRRFSKRCLQNESAFHVFASSAFKMKAPSLVLHARQIQRMIKPRSESVRGALQDGL